MSYGITLRTENGQTTVQETAGDIPEGTHHISGHEDHGQVQLSVTRRRLHGGHVASASQSHDREQHHA